MVSVTAQEKFVTVNNLRSEVLGLGDGGEDALGVPAWAYGAGAYLG